MTPQERRGMRFQLDKTVNIGNILTILILIATVARYGNDVINYLENINTKTNIMWSEYIKSHPEANNFLTR